MGPATDVGCGAHSFLRFGVDTGVRGPYLRRMRPVARVMSVSVVGAALLASLLAGPAVAAPAPAASPHDRAKSQPEKVTVDFVMGLPAGSASFVPIDESGEYRLVVRGVPDRVRVTELTTAEGSVSLPLEAFLAYWTGYGDATGQFEKRPPRAMVQGTDAEGDLVETVVWLRDASRQGDTVKFDAEVITNTKGLRKVAAKVKEVDQTDVGEHVSVSDPERLTDVEVFVDMPPKISQPDEETAGSAVRRADAAPTPRTLTCNGVRSSRLTTCWNDITPEQAQTWPGVRDSRIGYFKTQGPANGWIYEDVGVVDWDNHHWNPGPWARTDTRALSSSDSTFIEYFRHQTWWGIDKYGVTWYATDRCTWFLARWSPGGSCW